MNICTFSTCRRYRYTLKHRWDDLMPERAIMWVGLNPSTADETNLDPTLRRIKSFSTAAGCTAFVMTNLFAFRATDPEDMLREPEPFGPDNDRYLIDTLYACEGRVVAAWGGYGNYYDRDAAIVSLLRARGADILCLGYTCDGHPRHPLYVAGSTSLQPFKGLQ